MIDENGIDEYDPYAAPRPDDLYKRCKHGNIIIDECGTCIAEERSDDDIGQFADGDIYENLDDGFFRA